MIPTASNMHVRLAEELMIGGRTGPLSWVRGSSGAVPVGQVDWFGWQTVNVFEFMTEVQIADAKSGAAALDTTVAIQAAINAGNRVIFGDGKVGTKFKVTNRLTLHSYSDIDLNGSTVLWTGGVVTQENKWLKWDNSVFRVNNANEGTPVLAKNIHIRNGCIDANNWGTCITIRYVEGFEFSDLILLRAQVAGIAFVEACNGAITRSKLIDCSANPSAGWHEFNDLEMWSDGIFGFYGSQNVTISDCQVLNTRVATGRGGIVLEGTSAGYPGLPGKTTGNITVQDCYVSGYDRQLHVELANGVSAKRCTFKFIDSGLKRNSCAVVAWDTQNTSFDDCILESTGVMVFHQGAVGMRFNGSSLVRAAGGSAGSFFRNPDSVTSDITFSNCLIDFAAGDAALHDCDATFINTKLTGSVVLSANFYQGTFRFINCPINKVGLRTNLALATDIYEQNDCTYTGFGASDNIISAPSLGLVRLINPTLVGVGQFYIDSPHVIQGLDFTRLTVQRFNGPTYWNGEYLASGMPTTGTWTKGVRVRNNNPTIGQPKGWSRVTTGSGNALGTDWASEGNL